MQNEIKNQIAEQVDYKLYKAITISFAEDNKETNISLSIKRVGSDKIKVFKLSGRYLKEVDISINDGGVSFEGGDGTYYVFVEKTPWLLSTVGILTMTAILLMIVGGFVYFTMFKNSHQKQIATLVEERLQEKLNKGEEITTEDTLKIRHEVEIELKSQHKNKKKK